MNHHSRKTEVLILGAGVAGLAAACEIGAAGFQATVLEARDRIGGRIYTRRDNHSAAAVEMGAEFVHGSPREILKIVEAGRLLLCDASERHWFLRKGKIAGSDAFWPRIQDIMERLKHSRSRDGSFRQFLDGLRSPSEETKSMAAFFVQGFHAANIDSLGIRGLKLVNQAAESVGDDQNFRILNGYDSVPQFLYEKAVAAGVKFKLNAVAKEIRWAPNDVDVLVQEPNGPQTFQASRVIIALPLGVLQTQPDFSGGIRFVPDIPKKERAIRLLKMGHAIKITFVFAERFWEKLQLPASKGAEELSRLGFLHAQSEEVPTWWTQLPVRAPLLVGWAGGPKAETLSKSGEAEITDRALASLRNMLGVNRRQIERLLIASYIHDWQADPFARGAYSYIPVHGLNAIRELNHPAADTLFFAGEAINTKGHIGTVHGAIGSGEASAHAVIHSMIHHSPRRATKSTKNC